MIYYSVFNSKTFRKGKKMKKAVVTEKVGVLVMERRHGPARMWERIFIPAREGKFELSLGDLPPNEKLLVWFMPQAVILQPSFKITIKGNTVRPYEEVSIPRMSGQHDLTICGVKYGARVS